MCSVNLSNIIDFSLSLLLFVSGEGNPTLFKATLCIQQPPAIETNQSSTSSLE